MKNQIQLIFFAFLILITAVGGAFAVVWTRIETAQMAKENASFELDIARLLREEMHLSSVIANLERPESLQMLLAELGSDLAPVPVARQETLGDEVFLPDFEAVQISTMSVSRGYQLSSGSATRRPVFIRE